MAFRQVVATLIGCLTCSAILVLPRVADGNPPGFIADTKPLSASDRKKADELLQKYRGDVADVRSRLENLSCSGQLLSDDYEGRVTYRILGESAQEVRQFAPGKSFDKNLFGTVHTWTPDYEYYLDQRQSDGPYSLRFARPGLKQHKRAAILRWHHVLRYAWAAILVYNQELATLIENKEFRVLDVTQGTYDGQPATQYQFSLNNGIWFSDESGNIILKSGRFVLLPEHRQAVAEYELTLDALNPGGKKTSTALCEGHAKYAINDELVPQEISIREQEQFVKADRHSESKRKVVFEKIRHGIVVPKDFLPSQFGVSDSAVEAIAEHRTSYRKILLLLSANLIIFILLLWYWQRRRGRRPSAGSD